MGALRFRVEDRFLDDTDDMAAPPWTSLRELEQATREVEADREPDDDYDRWLRMLIVPGGSLGGARPKASVLDEEEHPWIAKFPSRSDESDIGAWEWIAHELARRAGLVVPQARVLRFASDHHTFLSKRFDRTTDGRRIHFASAMTMLQRMDGDGGRDGVSYLHLAEVLIQRGASPASDLEQLFRRIAFFVCISNTDDHLRNHGFMLSPQGWRLAPAYDVNPNPHGMGLSLNISMNDNAQDFALVLAVAPYFRVGKTAAKAIVADVKSAASTWKDVARECGLSRRAQERMQRAFRLAG